MITRNQFIIFDLYSIDYFFSLFEWSQLPADVTYGGERRSAAFELVAVVKSNENDEAPRSISNNRGRHYSVHRVNNVGRMSCVHLIYLEGTYHEKKKWRGSKEAEYIYISSRER